MVAGYSICLSKKCQVAPNDVGETPSPESMATFGGFKYATLSDPKSEPFVDIPVETDDKFTPKRSASAFTILSKLSPKRSFPVRVITNVPSLNDIFSVSKGLAAERTLIPFLNNTVKNFSSENEFHFAK